MPTSWFSLHPGVTLCSVTFSMNIHTLRILICRLESWHSHVQHNKQYISITDWVLTHAYGKMPGCFAAHSNWTLCYWHSLLYRTTRHFSTCVRERLVSDKASHIFKHLQNSEHCRTLCSVDCFHILDHASTGFQLKVKEAFHIQNEQPSLNQQLHDVNLKLSFYFSLCHVLCTFRCY